MMKHLLMVWHSQSGHTAQLCASAAAGIRDETAIELRQCTASQAGADDLLWAHALLLATPENFGYMSGALKDFFDRTYETVGERTRGLPYALMISCDNDGRGAVAAVERIASGYGWRRVADALICRGGPDAQALMQAHELGSALAAGLVMGLF